MRYSPTLSQTFDIGDFIAPDILSVVDESVRRAGEDVLAHGDLAYELDKTFKVRTSMVYVSDIMPEGNVPPFDPDEFMPYDMPEVPVIPDFNAADHEPVVDAPVIEPKVPDAEAETPVIETKAPLTEAAAFRAEPAEEQIAFAIPEPPRVSEGMVMVRRDLLRFDRDFKEKLRIIVTIAAIVAAIILLFLYLLHQ